MTPEIRHLAPPRGSQQASAREFLAVVFRRKWIILGLFAVATLTVLVISVASPTRYRSVGKVLVDRGEKESLMLPQRRLTNWEEELASEVQFIESHPVAVRAQQMLDAETPKGGRPLLLNIAQVDAEVVGASNAVLVAYVDRNPNVAQTMCDALIRAYVETRNQTFNLAYPADFFTRETGQVLSELTRLERSRRDYAAGNHAVALEDQQHESVYYLNELDQRRNETMSDLAAARTQQDRLVKFGEDPTTYAPTTGENGEQVLTDIKLRITQQEARIATLKEKYRDDSPEITNALATLEALRGLAKQETDARIEIGASRIAMLESKLKPIDAEAARVHADLANMPQKQMSLSEMDRQIDILRDRYSQLVKLGDQARITQETSKTVTVLVLSPAAPGRPTNTRDYVRLALAPAFSLVVGLGLAFFIDGLDSRVRTAGDAETASDLPVLASLSEHRRRRVDAVNGEEAASR